MNYPHIKIIGNGDIGSKVLFIQSADAEPIDLSGVVSGLVFEHTAGRAPELMLDVPLPVFECAVDAVKATVNFIERREVAQPLDERESQP